MSERPSRRRVVAALADALSSIGRVRVVGLGLAILAAGTLAPALAYVSKEIVDAALAGEPSAVLRIGLAYAAGQVLRSTADRAVIYLQYDVADRVSQRIEGRLLRVLLGSPGLEHLERADLADRVEAVRTRSWVPMNIIALAQELVHFVLNVGVGLLLLGTIHPALALVPFAVAPFAVLMLREDRRRAVRYEGTMREFRRQAYFLDLASGAPAAKEIRVFGLGPHIVRRYVEARRAHTAELVRAERRRAIVLGTVIGGQSLVLAAGIAAAVWLAATGRTTIGAVVMGVQIIVQSVEAVGGLTHRLGFLSEVMSMGGQYVGLLDYRPAVVSPPPGEAQPAPEAVERGIRLSHVTFAYPGSRTRVLRDVSLDIPAGTVVALVGDNGAGKTTLVKLLSRFYDPDEGAILIDGVDLRAIDLEAWRRRSTAVFQDFATYQLRARESIGLGDPPVIDDADRVLAAVRAADAGDVVDRLPRGLETQIGTEFDDGVELSHGQHQKVALARGSMRVTPALVVLDEPTASLDARAERHVYDRFAALAGRGGGPRPVTLLVSHRFSTVRMADLIVVLEKGRIVEVGTHAELVATGGLYAELYAMQSEAYR